MADLAENLRRTLSALFAEDLFTPAIVALAALGLFARPWSRRRWSDEALLVATLVPLASFWLFFVISRFLVGALPIGLLWAAAGLDHLIRWAQGSVAAAWPRASRSSARLASIALPALVVLLLVVAAPPRLVAGTVVMPWANVEAGRWLRDNTDPDAVVMTRHSEVGLYSGRALIASPNATWLELVAYGTRAAPTTCSSGCPSCAGCVRSTPRSPTRPTAPPK